MDKQNPIEKLLEEIAWQKELIEDTLRDPNLSDFEKEWLRNLIKYYKANKAKLKKLLRK